jgi:hypothetical protein
MAKITKPDMTYVWASGGSKTAPSSVKIQTGWIVEKPEFQKMNWVQNRQDDSLAYIFQMGVPEWDSAVEYQYSATYKSYVQRNGLVYKALQVGTNKDPASEAAYWTVAFDDKGAAATVQSNLTTHITNYGTLAGLTNAATARTNLDVYSKAEAAEKNGDATKLFSVANGTTGNEAVNKSQLDTKAPTAGNASQEFAVATATTGNSAVNLTTLINIVYPVGSVYISKTDNRNPNTILGIGTWAAVDGKALFGYKSADPDFGTAGVGGGSKNLSLTLTVDSRTSAAGGQAAPVTEAITANNTYSGYMNTGDRAITDDIDLRFKLSQEKILPPYDTFYIWERTA